MPFGWLGAEALLAAGDEVARPRGLGPQHQFPPALREGCDDCPAKNLGLARTSDAVEQRHAEAAAGVGQQLRGGVRLLWRETSPFGGKVELRRSPGGKLLSDQRAGIDQTVDYAWTHAGRLGQRGFHPGQAVRGELEPQ